MVLFLRFSNIINIHSSAFTDSRSWQNYTFLEQKGWFLIFLSIIDKNVNFTTTWIWSKNQLFLIKISNLKIMKVTKYILRKILNLTKKSNLTKISKLRKMLNFNYILHLPHLLPSFGIVLSFFLDRKEIFVNQEGTDLTLE